MLYSKPLGPNFEKFYFGTQGSFLRTLIEDMAFCYFCRDFCLSGAFLFISHQEYLHHLSCLGCAVGACLPCKCGDMDPRYI